VSVSGASIVSVSGPVVHARAEAAFSANEAVRVGAQRLLGEVLRLDGEQVVIQVYEDTTGLRPGDPVESTGMPLTARLGPGLLGGIFDGLLRPLRGGSGPFIAPGARRRTEARYSFTPVLSAGDEIRPGAVIGGFGEGPGLLCQAPPGVAGVVSEIAAAGEYGADEVICRAGGETGVHEVRVYQEWPVRQPRPVKQRLGTDSPLITGQRIIDSLYPVARGSRAAMPGGFGTGKTILQQALAKWCDADVIVYVGCGERGNEMAEVLHEFPDLEDPRTGRPLMERSVVIANTSNMPVAAREASIYTGVTVAEYFRDQGLDVAMMADSTSRWAEALREIAGRIGELPAEGGYPAYLGSRKAEFYERAGRAETLGGETGSVTLIGAVSPPGGDFSEPVTQYTQRNVRCFWPLDRDRARARFYPAIHPLNAYSEDAGDLARWWQEQGHAQWEYQRRQALTLLEEQARLDRMARIVGKDALPESQRLSLLCAELLNEGFLRQSAYSKKDAYCSPERQIAMLRTLMRFVDGARRALEEGVSYGDIVGLPLLRRLRRMGEEIGDDEVARFADLQAEIETALAGLPRGAAEREPHDER